jgi:hypothetical protein
MDASSLQVTETVVPGRRGVTLRAVLLAVVLIPFNAYWLCQMEVVRYEGHPTTVSIFYNSIFILFLLTGVASFLRRISPKLALHRNELLVIYVMVSVASAIAGHDLVEVVTPQIVMPYYLASPENKWEDLFFKYLPKHLTISDERIYGPAFVGGSTFYQWERIRAWSGPLLNWAGFLAVLSLVMLAMNSLLRKRWMDREKLSYPIVALPLEMTQERAPLWRNKMMWIGFGLAAAIDILNGFNAIWPQWPLIKVRVVHYDAYMSTLFQGYPWGALGGTRISFYPFAIGLGMLLPLDLAFSCWFFYIFWKAQRFISALVGWNKIPKFPFVEEQSSAAYLGLATFALWMARDQLRGIWANFTKREKADDADEPMRYQHAVWAIIGGLGLLITFAMRMGMAAWIAIVVFVLYYMLSLTVTRVRAELGPPAHDLHGGGPDLILTNILGTNSGAFGPQQLTSLSLFYWFNRAYRAHPMPIQMEAFKIAQVSQIRQSSMTMALAIAVVVGALAAFWAQVHCYYVYGMAGKMSFVAQTFGREPFQRLQGWLMSPQKSDFREVGAYGVGYLFTLALMALRVRFVWWPFHPVGYAISSSWSMNCLWLPIFIAWAAKATILKYGGFRVFQQAIPFALGLVLGEFIIGSVWTLIGIIWQIQTYAFWV